MRAGAKDGAVDSVYRLLAGFQSQIPSRADVLHHLIPVDNPGIYGELRRDGTPKTDAGKVSVF